MPYLYRTQVSPTYGISNPVRPSVTLAPQQWIWAGSPQTCWDTATLNSAPNNGLVWPTANTAYFVPFSVPVGGFLVTAIGWANGTTVGGNIDAGVYLPSGVQVFHTGNTAASGSTGQVQLVTVNAFLPYGNYYMALVDDTSGATSNISQFGASGTGNVRSLGVVSMASASPLPAQATFAALGTASTNQMVPLVCLTGRTPL